MSIYLQTTARPAKAAPISEAERTALYRTNAERLFKL